MYSRSPLWKRDSEHEHGRNALSIGRTFTRGDSRVTTGVLASIDPSVLAEGVNLMWVAMVCFLIFFMHAGFAMLEAGQVRAKNVANQLTKNLSRGGRRSRVLPDRLRDRRRGGRRRVLSGVGSQRRRLDQQLAVRCRLRDDSGDHRLRRGRRSREAPRVRGVHDRHLRGHLPGRRGRHLGRRLPRRGAGSGSPTSRAGSSTASAASPASRRTCSDRVWTATRRTAPRTSFPATR